MAVRRPPVEEILDAANAEQFADRLFQWICDSPRFFGEMVEVVEAELAACFDFTQGVRANRVLIGPDLKRSEGDVLMEAPFVEAPHLWGLVLGEHQTTRERTLRLRVHHYRNGIWQRPGRSGRRARKSSRRPTGIVCFVACFVVYTGEDPWDGSQEAGLTPALAEVLPIPDPLRARLARYLPAERIPCLDLRRADPEQLTAGGQWVGWLLRVLRALWLSGDEFRAELIRAAEHLVRMPGDREDDSRRGLWAIWLVAARRNAAEFAEWERVLDSVLQQAPHPARRKAGKAMAQTMAQVWKEQGMQQGMQQGIAQGVGRSVGTLQDIVLMIVRSRLSGVQAETEAAVRALRTLEELRSAADCAVNAESEAQLVARLREMQRGPAAEMNPAGAGLVPAGPAV